MNSEYKFKNRFELVLTDSEVISILPAPSTNKLVETISNNQFLNHSHLRMTLVIPFFNLQANTGVR